MDIRDHLPLWRCYRIFVGLVSVLLIPYRLIYQFTGSFMPSIILSLGYTSTQAQLMSSPPSATAFFSESLKMGSYL